jgi:hypothetical protein
MVTVREVQTSDVHASVQHFDKVFDIPACGTERANDFGLTVVRVILREDLVKALLAVSIVGGDAFSRVAGFHDSIWLDVLIERRIHENLQFLNRWWRHFYHRLRLNCRRHLDRGRFADFLLFPHSPLLRVDGSNLHLIRIKRLIIEHVRLLNLFRRTHNHMGPFA